MTDSIINLPTVTKPAVTSSKPPATSQPSVKSAKPLIDWTRADVQTWLTKNDLEHQRKKFDRFDGKRLQQLQMMYRNSPGTAFYRALRDLLDINDLPDLLQFAHLLNELE
jgi:hypothetical protein